MNWLCDDGIPYSVYKEFLAIGLASQKICFNIKLINSLNIVPIKNEI